MNKFIKEMDEAMVQLCNYSDIVEKTHRDYGIGLNMSPREIHLLETIHNHPRKNASELAKQNGLLKGTFSISVNTFITSQPLHLTVEAASICACAASVK